MSACVCKLPASQVLLKAFKQMEITWPQTAKQVGYGTPFGRLWTTFPTVLISHPCVMYTSVRIMFLVCLLPISLNETLLQTIMIVLSTSKSITSHIGVFLMTSQSQKTLNIHSENFLLIFYVVICDVRGLLHHINARQ